MLSSGREGDRQTTDGFVIENTRMQRSHVRLINHENITVVQRFVPGTVVSITVQYVQQAYYYACRYATAAIAAVVRSNEGGNRVACRTLTCYDTQSRRPIQASPDCTTWRAVLMSTTAFSHFQPTTDIGCFFAGWFVVKAVCVICSTVHVRIVGPISCLQHKPIRLIAIVKYKCVCNIAAYGYHDELTVAVSGGINCKVSLFGH